MAKIALNKSALSREKQRRASYERYLPSLEMKQKQLLAERKKAQQALEQQRTDIEQAEAGIAQHIAQRITNQRDQPALKQASYLLLRAVLRCQEQVNITDGARWRGFV